MPTIKKILVANRGEIALRILRSAKEMGMQTVAVFSEADRNSLHVRFADEAFYIGPAPSASSYLSGENIIRIAKEQQVDAIHPGYGFLSENAEFATNVATAGLIFIGPSAESITMMGDKLAAKEAVSGYNIPMVPGSPNAVTDLQEAKSIAKNIGYPVLIKASAGGGGKGMRIVQSEKELEDQMTSAISEAKSAFGDGSIFIEKYIESTKHIEVQILGDMHGNIIHLWDRECSIQRRHQKVIEEAPSMSLNEEVRIQITTAAVNVAKACNYYGAGTVEFIYDKGRFYFLEMNTRLQVEHPVTEMITGVDLVKEQILIASGKNISFQQKDICRTGHAIESRIYAEDPENDFLPDIGTLKTYKPPQGPGVRVDDGFEERMKVPIYYDPMIAKLITHGHDREEARQRMIRAISEYAIIGIKTTLPFCNFVMQHPAFINGSFDTKFVNNFFKDNVSDIHSDNNGIASVLAVYLHQNKKTQPSSNNHGDQQKVDNSWRNRINEWQ